MSDAVIVERRGDIALLILNRPNALNAISRDLARGVASTLAALDLSLIHI